MYYVKKKSLNKTEARNTLKYAIQTDFMPRQGMNNIYTITMLVGSQKVQTSSFKAKCQHFQHIYGNKSKRWGTREQLNELQVVTFIQLC